MSAHSEVRRVAVGRDEMMAVRDIGRGTPVLLVHGVPGSAASWGPVADQLAASHRVLVPDLIGFGASTRSHDLGLLGPAGQVRALIAALDGLGLGRVAWVGHDYGAMLALEVARTNPERVSHLALAATNTFPDTPIPFPLSTVTLPVIGGVFARLVFSGPSLTLTLRLGTVAPGCRLHPGVYLGDGDQQRAIGIIFAAVLRHLSTWYAPIEVGLAALAVPTVVIWGDRDPFFSAAQGRRTAEAIPGAEFVLLEGTGHFIPAERPAELADAVEKLLNDAPGVVLDSPQG